MNKKLTIIVLTSLINLITYSQEYEYIPFPDSNAIWSEIYQPPLNMYGDFPPPIFERFCLNGEDTIINEIRYKKLFIFYDSIFNKTKATYIGGIREDENKRVYFKGNSLHFLKPVLHSEEIVLYDFSLNAGDTIREINCMPDMDILIVDKVDTIQIANTMRKRIHFNPMPWVEWIEGIGSLKGLLFTSGDLPTNGLNNNLICFKQNNEILYFNNNYFNCFPELTTSIKKNNKHSNILVYPNPSDNNRIIFSFGEYRICSVQIMDCNGRLCGGFNSNMQSEFLLSTEKYQPGIYFYKAMNLNGMVHTGKFIVR